MSETVEIEILERAFYGPDRTPRSAPAEFKDAQLTISRQLQGDFQDRQIFLFVDGEPWGKIRYGGSMTREIAPGRHKVRAFNTLFSRTLDIDLKPAEHAHFQCGNRFPTSGWLMFLFLHVTYLHVRLERVAPES